MVQRTSSRRGSAFCDMHLPPEKLIVSRLSSQINMFLVEMSSRKKCFEQTTMRSHNSGLACDSTSCAMRRASFVLCDTQDMLLSIATVRNDEYQGLSVVNSRNGSSLILIAARKLRLSINCRSSLHISNSDSNALVYRLSSYVDIKSHKNLVTLLLQI